MMKRKVLGKGLSALIPDAHALDEKEGAYFMCPIEAIEPNPYQPRQVFSSPSFEDLVSSVREKGIITPLLVSKSAQGYQLIAGERRWRAAQRAGLHRVPAVVREATPTESLELALIENLHRKDLNAIEEATAYKRLLDETGITQDSLAKHIGKDRSSITNALRLLNLPMFIQEDLIHERIRMGHARVLAGVANKDEQKRLRDAIIQKGLSVRQTEALSKKKPISRKVKGSLSEKEYYLRSLTETLMRTLGTKVEIKKRGKEGVITIYFYSDDELDRLLDQFG